MAMCGVTAFKGRRECGAVSRSSDISFIREPRSDPPARALEA